MRLAAVDRMDPAAPDFSGSSTRFEQVPSRRAVAALLAVLIPAAALLLFPFYLLATTALADQGLRDLAATRPLATVQVLTGLAFWLLLLGFPIYRLLDTLTRSRTVEMASGQVTVEDRVFGRTQTWTAPLSDFEGIAHYLRASLGTVRHELILVHPDRDRSLLLTMANRLHQSDLDAVCTRLGLPEIPASVFRSLGKATPANIAIAPAVAA